MIESDNRLCPNAHPVPYKCSESEADVFTHRLIHYGTCLKLYSVKYSVVVYV